MINTFSRFNVLPLFLFLIFGSAPSAFVLGQKPADTTLSPYFYVNGHPNVDRLPLKGTKVDISVSGVIADVRVVQTYRNEGSRPINATYMFPASTRAAVYSMKMRIGDQVITAKIKRREEAKQDFEKAKEEGKSASLLEEHRPNVFSMKLANIMPNDEIEIELRYTELQTPVSSIYEVVYPTVIGPRYSSSDGGNREENGSDPPRLQKGDEPGSTLHIQARISAGVPITDLSCISHQIAPEWQGPGIAKLTLDEPNAFHGNRDFVLRYRLTGDQINSGLLLFRGENENFFLYMAQPPQRIKSEDIPPREYIFVVDVSGSMEGFPLNTAKKLLTDLIGGLKPTDLFNVVLFAGDSTLLSQRSLQANPENVEQSISLIEQQRGGGGTELLTAVQKATDLPRESTISRSIVLITDGYITGEKGVFDHIRKNLDHTNMFAFGIGSAVNRYLIEGVARAGMGEPFVVESEAEAIVVGDRFREYIQSPVLTNIKVESKGFQTYDVYPVHYPDLLSERPIIVFGKWLGDPTGTIELSGKTGQGDYHTTLQVAGVMPDEENHALKYLWARSRIAELSDFGENDASPESIEEVTALGLKYNLLTKHTSFIAIREVIRNPGGTASDVDQAVPLPVGVSEMAVGSEPELVWLFGLAVLIIVGVAFWRRLSWLNTQGAPA
jgi:Ca-activated chloride channel family protein